jgi:hypothetical protein
VWQMNYLQGGIISTNSGNTYNTTNGLTSFDNGSGSIVLDLKPWVTPGFTSNGNIGALIDRFNTLLCGGQLSPSAKSQIISYVSTLPYSTPTTQEMMYRVRSILHLLANSPDYTIQK